jgi:hypothetical protein
MDLEAAVKRAARGDLDTFADVPEPRLRHSRIRANHHPQRNRKLSVTSATGSARSSRTQ